jgi:anti-sigma factor RsiW
MNNFIFGRTDNEPHDEFLKLCVVSTSGELTNSERQRLEKHLSECRECREVIKQFNTVVDQAIPAIAAEYRQEEDETTSNDSWSQEQALENLLSRLPEQQYRRCERHQHNPFERGFARQNSETWRHLFMTYAAGVLLFAALGIGLYKKGVVHRIPIESVASPKPDESPIERRLADAVKESYAAHEQLGEREKLVSELRRTLQRQTAELSQLRAEQGRVKREVSDSESARNDLTTKQLELAQRTAIAEVELKTFGERLRSAETQAATEFEHALSLQSEVADLQVSLDAKNKTIEEQDELLAHDRDIRELMGERDLYVSEVYDVDGTGKTRKPCGRVFYTRGKSLVFYAYDLDQQKMPKNASFQAWGRLAEGGKKALSLGIFYQDNAAKKRWVLKTSDPQALSRVNEVFVTIEPNSGSTKPSNRRILFAYLDVDPNHP